MRSPPVKQNSYSVALVAVRAFRREVIARISIAIGASHQGSRSPLAR